MPVFYTLFSKPSAAMAELMALLRQRVGLPELAPGLEPYPGAWGLRTPGYYIFSMHFRNLPNGFEQFELDEGLRKRRNEQLEYFWEHAVKFAEKAKEIAACRQEQLVLYFGADDASLRSTATHKLQHVGKVKFGLKKREIGHMSPNYMGGVHDDATARARMAELGMAEWWAFVHSQWVVTTVESNFVRPGVSVGMNPRNILERLDVVQGRYVCVFDVCCCRSMLVVLKGGR